MARKAVFGIGCVHSTGPDRRRQGARTTVSPMIRRSFRIGLRLGLLFGVGMALVKTVQSRRAASKVPPPAPWEPIVETARPAPRPAPAAEPVDEVGEPILEPPAVATDRRTEPSSPAIDPALDVVAPMSTTAPKPAKATAKKAAKKPAKKAPGPARGFVEPDDGACPTSHPVKAKASSKIFHLPGMFAYDRTNADRCYADAYAAEADGFRPAKR